jgi:hypothetical protein
MVNRFTKFTWYITCKKMTFIKKLAMLLITHVYMIIRTLKNIISNYRSVFTSKF